MSKLGIKDDGERILLDSQFGSGATTYSPATWYVGMSSTLSADDGTGFTEPTGIGSYARVAVTNNATNWPAATTTAGKTTQPNGTAITFPNPTANWPGPFLETGLFTASTGGTPRYTNKLSTQITVLNGQSPVQFAANQLLVECKPAA